MDEFKNKNWLRDSRQLTSKVVFEPFVNNKSKIISAQSPLGDFNNIYSQITDDYGNIPTILEYNNTKKVGYLSFSMSSNKLATKYTSGVHKGEFNIEYSSYNVTDKDGWVINPDNGNREPTYLKFNMDTSLGNTARYIEIVGDIAHGEYPVEMQLSILNRKHVDNTPDSFDVYYIKGNTNTHCIIDLNDFVQLYDYFELRIVKWSKPYSSVKLNYVGTNIIFEASNRDLLINYETDCSAKNNGDLDYGLKYNTANIRMYSDDKSFGKLYKVNDGNYNFVSKTLNRTDMLVENQTNIKCSFYIRTEMDLKYSYIGKYFAHKVDYNSQSDVVNISLYDIASRLQSIKFFGIGQIIGGTTLFEILERVSTFLIDKYGIKINFSDISIKEIAGKIYVNNPVYGSENVWEFLDGCCFLGQFYIVADCDNENYDLDIIMER